MASNQTRVEEARLRAQQKFSKAEQRDKTAFKERDKAFAAMMSKSARLRSLRLAKEASDKEEAERQAAEKKAAADTKAAARKRAKRAGGSAG